MGDAADAEGKQKHFQARQEALIEELASIRKDVIRWGSTFFPPTVPKSSRRFLQKHRSAFQCVATTFTLRLLTI